jgi:anti-sigma regulatory factor (Ser/Thr protein kinase)
VRVEVGVRETFAATAFAARQARQRLAQELERANVPLSLRSDALMLANELISNAIQHGSRDGDRVELSWAFISDRLVVTVSDAARRGTAPVLLTPNEDHPAGRGLLIVERISDSWADRIVDGRREVSFTLLLHPARTAPPL